MNKKFFLFLGLLISTDASAEIVSGNNCGSNCQWTLNTDTGEMTISGSGQMYQDSYDYDGAGWTQPWESYKSSIKSVNISEGITFISHGAFSGAINLTSVNIPDSVTNIGNSSFSGTGLTSVQIPASVTYLHANAFRGNSHLTDITFEGDFPSAGIGWIMNAPSDLVVTFSGKDSDKDKLAQAIAIGGVYQENCDANREHCTYIPSAEEDVMIRQIKSNGEIIYYDSDGKKIRTTGKKIYTVEEAAKISKPTGNTFKLRYK